MHRDDRLFAIIGGAVVTASATFFLAYAGGLSGPTEVRPKVRVAPISGAAAQALPDEPESPAPVESTLTPPEVIRAGNRGFGSGLGDDTVRSLVAGISSHPQWVAWLFSDDLLSRFVAIVEAVADGYCPADELGFMAARGPFVVREHEGRLVIAAGTFRRYNLAVDVLASVDAADAVAVFRRLEPEIAEARRDLAWHRGPFEDRLRLAIDHLLAVEIPDGVIEVERRTTTFAFAADEHEQLSGAQRQLLRMGWENATSVQTKLREIRAAFGWPEVPSPAATRHAVISGEEAEALEPVLVADVMVDDSRSEAPSEIAAVGLFSDPVTIFSEPSVWDIPSPRTAVVNERAAPAESQRE